MPPVKRLRFFDGEFLKAVDFQAEQDYHVGLRRAQNRSLYVAGIADGLDVIPSGATAVVVKAGRAVDDQGRDIVLASDSPPIDLSSFAVGTAVWVTVAYAEQDTDPGTFPSATGNTRWTEQPQIQTATSQPGSPTAQLILATATRATATTVNVTQANVGRRVLEPKQLADIRTDIGTRVRKTGDSISGALSIAGTLNVQAAASVSGTLTVQSNSSVGGTLSVQGNASLTAQLSVQGNAAIGGDVAIQGKHAFRGNDTWLRLNQDGAFSSGTHTPGNFAPAALNVGGAYGWGNPGGGNAWVSANLTVGAGSNGVLKTRHIDGKNWTDDSPHELHLNWSTGTPVVVGGSARGDLYVGTRYAQGDRIEGWSGGGILTWDLFARGGVYSPYKRFLIDHPLDPQRRQLVHQCIEGPEAGVYYRGEAQLEAGEARVRLPDYFEALTRDAGRSVMITPQLDADGTASPLAASPVEGGEFLVRPLDGANPSQRFYWEVKAVRADVKPLEVERAKHATTGEEVVGGAGLEPVTSCL